MKVWKMAAIGAGTCAVAAAVLVTAPAWSSSSPATDQQLVKPAVTNESGKFFTAEQIQNVWEAVVKNFPNSLPAGKTFPEAPPALLDPAEKGTTLYQVGLVDEAAAAVWRCDWLAEDVRATKANDSTSATTASRKLDAYWSLPSISVTQDKTEYDVALSQFTKLGDFSSALSAKAAFDCGIEAN